MTSAGGPVILRNASIMDTKEVVLRNAYGCQGKDMGDRGFCARDCLTRISYPRPTWEFLKEVSIEPFRIPQLAETSTPFVLLFLETVVIAMVEVLLLLLLFLVPGLVAVVAVQGCQHESKDLIIMYVYMYSIYIYT